MNKGLTTQDQNLKLSKSMYAEAIAQGKSFQDYLEEKCPTPEGCKLNAFQRQLKRFSIKVHGDNADIVEKFFATGDSAILFPAYVSEVVRQGFIEANDLKEITAVTTKLDADTYKALEMNEQADERTLRAVSEGEELPELKLFTKEKEVHISKYGAVLKATYEAVRRKKLPVFEIFLKRIGAQIAVSFFEEALYVLINGDGNNNEAEVSGVQTIDTLTYEDFVRFWAKFKKPYKLRKMIMGENMIVKTLLIPEFKDKESGFKFTQTGELISPVGGKIIRHDDSAIDGLIIGLDERYALEQITEQNIKTEKDKLITSQWERTAITLVGGFAKLMPEAVKVLSIKVAYS